jgi:nucleoside phosphorylase
MSVDVLLYVALGEEFHYVMDMLGEGFDPREAAELPLTYFVGKLHSPIQQRDLSVVVVPAIKMGNTRSGTIASAVIGEFNPQNVVVVGIAGSLTAELSPGDVFIPDSVNEYMANSASVADGDDAWTLDTSGNRFTTTLRLLNRFALFRKTQKRYFEEWTQAKATNFDSLITPQIREALASENLSLPTSNKLVVGDDKTLASGPVVGKGVEFGRWVRKRIDRKIAAMEMESAGVYDATLLRTKAPRAIAIRGISDFADERKDRIEKVAGSGVRLLAVRNAVSVFVAAVRAGLFREEETDSSPPPQGGGGSEKLFEIKLVQLRDDQGKYIGEGLEHGELEAATLAQQILNARNAGYALKFAVRYSESDAIRAEKTRLEAEGNLDLAKQQLLADHEHRLNVLDYDASMVQRRLEILFCSKLTRKLPGLAYQYAQRILGILELMRVRSGWSGSSYDVEVWHAKTQWSMAGPVGQEIWNTEGFRAYLARGGGHEDYIVNAYSVLRDRRCYPLMIDIIAQTSFIAPTDREFGHYGPMPDDDALFDLDNWRVQIQ